MNKPRIYFLKGFWLCECEDYISFPRKTVRAAYYSWLDVTGFE